MSHSSTSKPYDLLLGDNRELICGLADNSVDSIVCDPPYGLGKEPNMHEVLEHWLRGDDYTASGGGFMGKAWDSFVPGPGIWKECLRVLKPGGHLLAFFGSRTYDLGTLAVRLAGFEVRDQIMWVYGSGMPKSHNLKGPWQGWGTTLKPSHEPICVGRKPFTGTVASNVEKYGTGALNIDACRVDPTGESKKRISESSQESRYTNNGPTNFSAKPGVRGGDPKGRWPANLVHDGSQEVLDLFPQSKGQLAPVWPHSGARPSLNCYGDMGSPKNFLPRGDVGSAARFFYCAKTSPTDRHEGLDNPGPQFQHGVTLRQVQDAPTQGNNHPTVKPTRLMRWLCRLVTPPGGTVLDHYMGSGSTGKACMMEGLRFIGMENEEASFAIAHARISHAWATHQMGINQQNTQNAC